MILGHEGLTALLGIDLHVSAGLDVLNDVVPTDFFKCLHFTCEPQGLVYADIEEGSDSIGIPAYGCDARGLVYQNERKDAVQGPEKGRGVVFMKGPEGSYDRTVRLGCMVQVEPVFQLLPVIDLSVTGPGDPLIGHGLHALWM